MSKYDGPERRRGRVSWQSVVALLAVALAAWSTLGVAMRNDEIGRLAEENAARVAESAEAHDALCVLRADLERRVASSREFLEENPNGIPGISAKTIRTGIRNQERTIQALDGISCP